MIPAAASYSATKESRNSAAVLASGDSAKMNLVAGPEPTKTKQADPDVQMLGDVPLTGLTEQLRALVGGIGSRRKARTQPSSLESRSSAPRGGRLVAQLNEQNKARGCPPVRRPASSTTVSSEQVTPTLTSRRPGSSRPGISPEQQPQALMKQDYVAVHKRP